MMPWICVLPSPYVPTLLVFTGAEAPWTIRSMDGTSPWTMRPWPMSPDPGPPRRCMITTTATRFAWVALGALRAARAKPRLAHSNLTCLILTSTLSHSGMVRKGLIFQETHHPREASSKGRTVQRTYRSWDIPSKGRIVLGTHRPRDASSEGTMVQEWT